MTFNQNNFKYIVVLDLEGKAEITEISSVILDTHLRPVSNIQLFVKNYYVDDNSFKDYVNGKYGQYSLSQKFFKECKSLQQQVKIYNEWIHSVINPNDCIFITCGNWDLRKQIPKQLPLYGIKVPYYWKKYVNIKEVFGRLECIESKGMGFMLNHYNIPLTGNHHCALDDVFNISKIIYYIFNKINFYNYNVDNFFKVRYLN